MHFVKRGPSPWLPQSMAWGSDQGGDDEREYFNFLAQRFRPYLKFSHDNMDEEMRPCSWQWLYEHSLFFPRGEGIGQPVGAISTNYGIVLGPADIRHEDRDWESQIAIDDDHREGQSWTEAQQGTGSYCHCTRISPTLINIEYWILFGYNRVERSEWTDIEVAVGSLFRVIDHQGDLIGVQLVYDQFRDSICRATFSMHGEVIEVYGLFPWPTMLSPPLMGYTSSPVVLLEGKDINFNPTTIEARKVSLLRSNYYQSEPEYYDAIFWSGTVYTPSDPFIYFAKDPVTNRFEHIVLFLELGSHEPWPNDTGYFVFVAEHNGKGVSFLPERVSLLDKKDDEAFIYFGGRLGDPAGIMRHRMWTLEEDISIPPEQRKDQDPYAIAFPPTFYHDLLGNTFSHKVHNFERTLDECEIDMMSDRDKKGFAYLPEANAAGFINCAHCIGKDKISEPFEFQIIGRCPGSSDPTWDKFVFGMNGRVMVINPKTPAVSSHLIAQQILCSPESLLIEGGCLGSGDPVWDKFVFSMKDRIVVVNLVMPSVYSHSVEGNVLRASERLTIEGGRVGSGDPTADNFVFALPDHIVAGNLESHYVNIHLLEGNVLHAPVRLTIEGGCLGSGDPTAERFVFAIGNQIFVANTRMGILRSYIINRRIISSAFEYKIHNTTHTVDNDLTKDKFMFEMNYGIVTVDPLSPLVSFRSPFIELSPHG